jgi:fumarate hydratase class II
MHIASVLEVKNELMPALEKMEKVLKEKSLRFKDIIKVGRTHLMDAVPITIGQEFSGYTGQIKFATNAIKQSLENFYPLALGGTAVGTCINTHSQFAKKVANEIAKITKLPFKTASNKFTAISSHDPFVGASGSLKTLACALIKICSDISIMASGPRSGFSEFILPQNEPGSSIMAGKVNPTQCEALTMASIQVIANDAAITMGASRGNFQLNAYKPLIIYNYLQSVRILAQSIDNFVEHLLKGLKPNKINIKKHLDQSLMLVTCLNPILGYDKCAEIVRFAEKENCSIKEATLKLNFLSSDLFDKYVDPKKMV